MLQYATRKAPVERICLKCEMLEGRVDAETNSIVEVLDKVFTKPEEKSQELEKAVERRARVLENYLEHLDAHNYATAA
jgi:hypothetical protein